MWVNDNTSKLEKFCIENANATGTRNIKQLKPNLKSKFKQGYFDIQDSRKYADCRPCIYRSSNEFKFMAWLEACTKVVAWVSEPFAIPYKINGKARTYSVDFIVLFDNGKMWFTEVKPYAQTLPGSYDFEMNKKKWNAAIEWCKERDEPIQFALITERFRLSI